MKKIISLILSISVMLSMFAYSACAENTHWAYNSAQELVNKGIVSGYSDGTLKLDNNITRAEFIKIINKSFGYTKKADVSFPDVADNEWYYEDMLIAKGEGYISGDNNGNANPEQNITRAESSVILARIFKLDTTKKDADISDLNEIPDWAKGAVVALFDKGIIKGYDDGSFRYNNNLTRGEGFTLIGKVLPLIGNDSEEQAKEDAPSVKEEQVNVSVSTGSGGVGGGGGGGIIHNPPVITSAATPVLKNNPDSGKNKIAWNECTGAESYNIKICLDNENDYFINNYNGTSVDLTNDFALIAKERTNASEIFTVYVMANGKNNISDSGYSEPIQLVVEFSSLSTPVIKVRDGFAGGIHRAIFTWDPVDSASGYEIKVINSDGTEADNGYTIDLDLREVVIPDTSIFDSETKVLFVALSDAPDVKNSLSTEKKIPVSENISSDSETQNGSKNSPWVITNAEQLYAIGVDGNQYGYKLSHHYVIINDITITKPIGTGEGAFSGSITGKLNGTDYKPTIRFNVGKSDSPHEYQYKKFGFVPELDEGAVISNLNFDGEIYIKNGSDLYVGAVAGTAKEGAKIEKCTNHTIISSTGYVGGMLGFSDKVTDINNCANFAPLYTTGSNAGGIIGQGRGEITKCYNEGTIKGNKVVGGIAGDLRYATVTQCANKGNVYAFSDVAGGIIGMSSSNADITISECFNTGDIYSPTSKPSAGVVSGKVTIGKNTVYSINDFYNTGYVYNAVYDENGEVIDSEQSMNSAFVYELGKSASFFKYKINRLYSVIPLANYIENFTNEKTLPYSAEISCNDVYFLGEWAGDNSYIGTDRLGTSLDGNALLELIENDNEFKESNKWTVVEGYEYPQLKNNPHLHSKEVIPALKNYSFETAVSEGIYSIKYNWTLPQGIKELKIKVVNNTRIENVTGTNEDGWIILDFENSNANGFVLENVKPDCYYEIFIKSIFSEDGTDYYQENYEHFIKELTQ